MYMICVCSFEGEINLVLHFLTHFLAFNALTWNWKLFFTLIDLIYIPRIPIFRKWCCNNFLTWICRGNQVCLALFGLIFIPKIPCQNIFKKWCCKEENILKVSLDSIPPPSPSVKMRIMSGKVCSRCKGKTLLGIVNKLFVFISLLTSPSNVLPYYLK